MEEKWWKKESVWLLLIALIAFLFRFPLIFNNPLHMDEPLYAAVINEFIKHPGLVPAFYGTPVLWKPILSFAAYAPLVVFFNSIGIQDIEALYRLPSVFFGVLNALVVYFLMKKIDFEQAGRNEIALMGALIYATMPLTIQTETLLLIDPFLVLLVNLALLCYTNAKKKEWLAMAFVLSFLAAWTKTFAALIIPALALVYWAWRDRRLLGNWQFLISLAGVPLGVATYMAVVWNIPSAQGQFLFDATGRFFFFGILDTTLRGLSSFTALTLPWIAFSVLGLNRFWRRNPFCTFWIALALPLMLVSFTLFWYFLPIAPAVAWFSARYLSHPRIDWFTALFFVLLFPIVFAGVYAQNNLTNSTQFEEQKEIGIYLQDKGNVLYFGHQAQTMMFYFLYENPKNNYTVVYTSLVYSAKNLTDELADNVTRGKDYYSIDMNEGFYKGDIVSWGTWKGEYAYIATQPEFWMNYSKAFEGYGIVKNSSDGSYQVFKRVKD